MLASMMRSVIGLPFGIPKRSSALERDDRASFQNKAVPAVGLMQKGRELVSQPSLFFHLSVLLFYLSRPYGAGIVTVNFAV